MNQFYREYLDTPVDRFGTCCTKWDGLERYYGSKDLIAAWVADMDFRTVPAVQEAMEERIKHAIYGYTENMKAEKAAEIGWLKRRHNCDVEPEWIMFSPGVIDSLFFCVRALTEPEDAILIQPPVYGPFEMAVNVFERKLVKNLLVETEDGWKMDFEDMEKKFAEGNVKMMILCSPHNPVGRLWTREELERVVELTSRYGVTLVVDEIHGDFAMPGNKQVRIYTLDNTDHCVMLTSATKSFNLAGLRQSSCIIKNPEIREKVAKEIRLAHADTPNIFGAIAQMTAYNEGDEWMDALVEYIAENRDYVVNFCREQLPEIKVRPQGGTYLMWLDVRGLNMKQDDVKDLLVNKAHVALSDGRDYGKEGDGFFRMNVASPRKNIEQAMENIKNAIRGR